MYLEKIVEGTKVHPDPEQAEAIRPQQYHRRIRNEMQSVFRLVFFYSQLRIKSPTPH